MIDDESIAVPKANTRSLAEVGSGKVVLVSAPFHTNRYYEQLFR
jgi:hypothetical protein